MRFYLLCLLAISFIFSCKGQDKSQEPIKEEVYKTENNDKVDLRKQKACEAISLTTIADLMGVDKSLIIEDDMSFGEKRSICYYYSKEGNRKFYIRMAWKSEKAQENKVLQNIYSNLLSNGEDLIDEYTEVQNTDQGQILFGIDQDHENNYIHILRKRYGNKADIQLELTKENKDEMTQKILMKILSEIE